MKPNNYFNLRIINDNLIINTRTWNPKVLEDSSYSFDALRSYYARSIPSPDLIVKVTVHGLSSNMTFKHEYITLSSSLRGGESVEDSQETEEHQLTYLIIHDDLFSRHLRAILEIIAPRQIKNSDLNSSDSYTISLPNHFEAFDMQNRLIPTDVVLAKLEDNKTFDVRKSACLLVVGKSFNKEFKDPIKILGLTQIRLGT